MSAWQQVILTVVLLLFGGAVSLTLSSNRLNPADESQVRRILGLDCTRCRREQQPKHLTFHCPPEPQRSQGSTLLLKAGAGSERILL
ncbi:hypothetical protein B0T17DRAFT_524910 [Bombardia bombarda]|uniref:Uncharacterized protein n=1 Tax=Bombardia bombarda TaxID=252184 RepID=A0AA39X8C2_9PEZI|nr:hypothetical protein B0T17DRAFT_524910 [Bombardia bombarda]